MFRPGQGHPQAGPQRHGNNVFPGPPPGMPNFSRPFPPPFLMQGRGGPQPHFSGPHPSFPVPPYHPRPLPISSHPPPLPVSSRPPPLPVSSRPPPLPVSSRPPPLPVSPPSDAPPPPPPAVRAGGPPSDPPAMPRDPDMLKNIDVLSTFVVKHGLSFENTVREKQAGQSKFGFLFGGEPGTEAATGRAYYEWRKQALRGQLTEGRTPAPPLDLNSEFPQGSGATITRNKAPASPAGSDMDMEDDFGVPPASEKKSASLHRPVELMVTPSNTLEEELVTTGASRSLGQLGVQDVRGTPGLGAVDRGKLAPPAAPETGRSQNENQPTEARRRKDTRRRTGFDRPCMEDVGPKPSPPRQTVQHPREREPLPVAEPEHKRSSSVNGHRADGAPRPSRWGPRDPSPPPDVQVNSSNGASERDEPSSEEAPAQAIDSERDVPSHEEPPSQASGKGSERLEAVTPVMEDDSSSKSDTEQFSKGTSARSDDRASREVETAKEAHHSSEPEPVAPTVDEFGRLIRKGASDSDGEDTLYSRKRRRSSSRSRSRSRSPLEGRRRRRSRSRSPRRRVRRSRSRSRSPMRHHRSWSRSPPPRDSRWGGEGGRGNERGFQDRGGRRGGRGGERGGGLPPACFDFAKGRCFRGSSCRFLHQDNSSGPSGDQGGGRYGSSSSSRGGRGGRRDNGEESERGWGGGRSRGPSSGPGWGGDDPPRARRGWEPAVDRDNEDERTKASEDRECRRREGTPLSEPNWEGDEQALKPNALDTDLDSSIEKARLPEHETVVSTSQHSSGIVLSGNQSTLTGAPSFSKPPIGTVTSLPLPPDFPPPPQLPNLSQQQSGFSGNSAHTQQLGTSVNSSIISPLPPLPAVPVTQQQQGFSPNPPATQQQSGFAVNLPGHQQQGYNTNPLMMQPGFSAPPPPPPLQPGFTGHLPSIHHQPSYAANTSQQPGYSHLSNASSLANVHTIPSMMGGPPQMGQNLPLPSRAGLSWAPTYGTRPMQGSLPSAPVGQQQQGYSYLPLPPPPPPPPPTLGGFVTAAGVYHPFPQPPTLSISVSAPNEQYDPLSDSLEPEPPGAVESGKKHSTANLETSDPTAMRQPEDQWKGATVPAGANESATNLRGVGMVILESVSPGLPGYHHRGAELVSVTPRPSARLVMGSVSPTTVSHLSKEELHSHQGATAFGTSEDQGVGALENVSPAPEDNRSLSPNQLAEMDAGATGAKDWESNLLETSTHQQKGKRDKEGQKEGRGLTLVRAAVAEYVKEVLKPTWREGHMSKEAFKTIAKKAVDKVLGALQPHQVPKTPEKVESYMASSKAKISKLVQGYVDKYVKT